MGFIFGSKKAFEKYLSDQIKEELWKELHLGDILSRLESLEKAQSNTKPPAEKDLMYDNQLERCKLVKNGADSDAIEKLPRYFPESIQGVLDCFDFEDTAEKSAKLGFTYGRDEHQITAKELVKDAYDMFIRLEKEVKDGETGRLQLGRLCAVKSWDSASQEPWYILYFYVERSEV